MFITVEYTYIEYGVSDHDVTEEEYEALLNNDRDVIESLFIDDIIDIQSIEVHEDL